jgi:hypothetical protein
MALKWQRNRLPSISSSMETASIEPATGEKKEKFWSRKPGSQVENFGH